MYQKWVTFLLLFLPGCWAQSQVPDTAFVATSRNHVILQHEEVLKAQSRLNNGTRYVAPVNSFEEHPWFASEDWLTGSVYYDGELFDGVALMLDLSRDLLISEHYPSGQPIALISEKVRSFTLAGHFFENIDNASVNNSLPGSGFYEILYPGETRLIARRQKLQKQEIKDLAVEIYYDERSRYFIFKNGVYFPVKGRSTALRVLKDKKPEIKRYLRQANLSFASDREPLLRAIAEFYDTLR